MRCARTCAEGVPSKNASTAWSNCLRYMILLDISILSCSGPGHAVDTHSPVCSLLMAYLLLVCRTLSGSLASLLGDLQEQTSSRWVCLTVPERIEMDFIDQR